MIIIALVVCIPTNIIMERYWSRGSERTFIPQEQPDPNGRHRAP